MKKVRVLIVDDSATMRAVIAASLSNDPAIEICGSAADPFEAREAIKSLKPDVLTLDVEMPRMNGLEFLEKLMRLRPMPVIMVSTLTHQGAEASIQALEIGAFDCVGKPSHSAPVEAFAELPEKVKAAAGARVRSLGERPAPMARPASYRGGDKLLAIGSSTGGVEALITVLSSFPENCPPTLITQHMPATFTRSFAARLDKLCAPRVQEATDGAPIAPGQVYVAPGGTHHLEATGKNAPRCRLHDGPPVSGHRPSVDALFHSVAAFGANAVGVILTGMGRDGAQGMLAMRQAGARTIGQDEASCVVYGMPKAALENGAVERQLPLSRIAALALDWCSADSRESV